MPERYERVLVGWHCAKVKGRVELKIKKNRVKTGSYDISKRHHSNCNSFGANAHLHQIFLKTVKVIQRSPDVTSRSKFVKSNGSQGTPVLQIWCNSDHYFWSYDILKKNGMCFHLPQS